MEAQVGSERARGRADATRDRLLAAAVEAFAAKGFHGTTTRDIATAAGMSPAALYVHHRSKEELLYLISRSGHEATLDLVRDAKGSAHGATDRLRAVAGAFARHHATNPTIARIVNYELAALVGDHAREVSDLRHAIDLELRELIVDGVEEGAFDCDDPRLAAAALLSMGVDLARWYHGGGTWSPDDIGQAYASYALRVVGAAG